ncbi:hypothetical protein U9M48_014841 [Paspalum notatum var. saurae]|uniref:Alpha/beta hydrolase fold-3 domain-containing protein n=1 Tax=Paspalum notatum var. saurae TaxID=547442 RepID=A0AAQ3T2B8_PASNO
MDPASELEFNMPGFLRMYKNGRVERFQGNETVPPSPAADPANGGVASKDVVLDPATGISARLFLPSVADADPAKKKLPVVVFFHGGAFLVHSAASPLYHLYAASLAAAVPAVVVSVNYRLAPESRIPGPYEDAFAAHRISDFEDPEFRSSVLYDADVAPTPSPGSPHTATPPASSSPGIAPAPTSRTTWPYGWGRTAAPMGTAARVKGKDPTWDFICDGKFGLDHPYINPMASPEVWRQLGSRRVLVITAEHCWFVDAARAYAEDFLFILLYLIYFHHKCGWEGELEFYETKGEGHVFFLFKHGSDNALKEFAVVSDFVRRS